MIQPAHRPGKPLPQQKPQNRHPTLKKAKGQRRPKAVAQPAAPQAEPVGHRNGKGIHREAQRRQKQQQYSHRLFHTFPMIFPCGRKTRGFSIYMWNNWVVGFPAFKTGKKKLQGDLTLCNHCNTKPPRLSNAFSQNVFFCPAERIRLVHSFFINLGPFYCTINAFLSVKFWYSWPFYGRLGVFLFVWIH